ncbi:MAG TPA: SGNH/GDSL hydrolase family protein, partial [Anaerolineales bacterium]|nr:SGNH/GDSL hydrolase family protein [Anaerolineales bacterium]
LLTAAFAYPIMNLESNFPEHPMKFLALGDSYTIGESVLQAERWPVQLADLLNARGIETAPPDIIAKTGWTTDELMEGIIRGTPMPPYDLVSLLIGVNNQYRGYPPEVYREEFATLLEQAIDFAGGDPDRVIVLSIPDWGVTPFGANDARGRTPAQISAEIALFNTINREETLRLEAHYVDITPISEEAKNDLTLLAPDHLHPSGKMYAQWAEQALPIVLEILSRP